MRRFGLLAAVLLLAGGCSAGDADTQDGLHHPDEWGGAGGSAGAGAPEWQSGEK